MKKTQIDALLKQVETGKLESDKAKILSEIKRHAGLCSLDLCKRLNMNIRTVSGRLSDLEDDGLIISQGATTLNGSQHTTFSFAYNEVTRERVKANRKLQSYLRALKKVYKFEVEGPANPFLESLERRIKLVENKIFKP